VGRHRLAARLGALELGRQAAAVEEPQIGLGAVGGIGPDTARQIVAVEDLAELSAAMGRRMGHGEAPHQAVDGGFLSV